MQPDAASDSSMMDQFSSSTSPTSAENESKSLEFTEGEVIRIELFEESPKLDREVVIREKVQIKKVLTSAESQP